MDGDNDGSTILEFPIGGATSPDDYESELDGVDEDRVLQYARKR